MKAPRRRGTLTALVFVVLATGAVTGQTIDADVDTVPTWPQYEPYEFLIGEWDNGVDGVEPSFITRFQWGPLKTYIWYSGSQVVDGEERPNFAGVLVWNGVRQNLDMLVTLDLSTGGLVQEHGEVYLEPDGTVVRDITVVYSEGEALPPDWQRGAGPGGATAHFRHSFKAVGPDEIHSSVLREDDSEWVLSFPGSDRLIMKRRAGR